MYRLKVLLRQGRSNNMSFDLNSLVERPIKRLDIKDRVKSTIVSQGVFLRDKENNKTVAELVQSDFLSFRLADEFFKESVRTLRADNGLTIGCECLQGCTGIYLVVDLGREETGFIDFEVDTEEGVVIDIAYGEHLDDLRVRAYVGDRHFADRYVCKNGHQTFTHFVHRVACRYIQLHISNIVQKFILYYAGLRPVEYPIIKRGDFVCSDKLHHRIYRVGVRTLHLCMHDHYEDCPWREQSLYSMDSRNQALCGYYCFGDYDFPEASFRLLGHRLGDDGYLEMCAPAEHPRTIPAFSMMWIVAVAEHLLYSGRTEMAESLIPTITTMIENYLKDLRDGLMPRPVGKRYWHFYEWTDGLSGSSKKDPHVEFDAPLNLFLCLALDSASYIYRVCGNSDVSEYCESVVRTVRSAIHRHFWDEESGAYRTYIDSVPRELQYAELVQALALYAHVCPDNLAKDLRGKLGDRDNGLSPITLSHSIFKFEALLQEPKIHGDAVFEMVARDWGHMLFQGATGFWETLKGANDFNKAGSLCHGWSAVPVYLYHRYVLGVKPLEPGFRTFQVEPLFALFDNVSGKVPTPHGVINVSWSNTMNGAQPKITYPKQIKLIGKAV
jgi:alpha-L-rhamnosidase